MKSCFNRLISISLVFIMLISVISAAGLTVSAEPYGSTCGDDLRWTLDEDSGILTISGSGDMDDYTSSSSPFYLKNQYIKSVIIEEGITSIGDYAFYHCNMPSITIPDSVTSIGDHAFSYCNELTSVTIPDNVTSIGYRAFYNCKGLKSVTIGNGVTSIGGAAFYYCSSLTSITIPDSVTSIGGSLLCNTALYNDSSNWNNNVLYIGNHLIEADDQSVSGSYYIREGTLTIAGAAFYGCHYLTSITIPGSVVSIGDKAFDFCDGLTSITIPDSITSIGDEAFSYCKSLTSVTIPNGVTSIGYRMFFCCNKLTSVTIPDSVTSIGENAFYNCESLTSITIPDSVTSINSYAFYNCSDFKIICFKDSYADTYAQENGIPVEYIRTDDPSLSVDNYDISVTEAEYITYIRYAPGEYATALEIKNAEGCVTLNTSKVTSYTTDGICTLAMPDGGVYSLWIKLNDGSEFIYTADLTVMKQEVVSDGVTMTVKNLYGVKDYFIAKGAYTAYDDVKENSVVQITEEKIGLAHDYTYILSEPGVYTVCVRYDDTTRTHEFITVELTVNEPTFTENGLQLKVGNLDGVKVIRTAYGEYSTPGEIKRAEGSRAFTAKTVLKNGDEYAIQYREEGVVTVAVVYNNGYEVMYTYNVTKKTPEMTQEGSTVTFTNLDDLKVIRYAEGEYTTSNQIKNAKGSVVLKPEKIVDGAITVTLEAGTYTFCVQYNDESYNYYVVTIE